MQILFIITLILGIVATIYLSYMIFLMFTEVSTDDKKLQIHTRRNYTHYDFMVEWLASAKKQMGYFENPTKDISKDLELNNKLWTGYIIDRTSLDFHNLYKANSSVVGRDNSFLALVCEYTETASNNRYIPLIRHLYNNITDVSCDLVLNEDSIFQMKYIAKLREKPQNLSEMISKLEKILEDPYISKILKESTIKKTLKNK